MESEAFSTLIEADVQVVADRTMTWDSTGYGSHAERGILTRTATTVVSGGRRDARLLRSVLPDSESRQRAADIEITYLLPAPQPPIVQTLHGAAQQPSHDPGRRAAGARGDRRVRRASARPMACRSWWSARCISAGPDQPFAAGHESAGVTAPATRWFLAEGATGSFFNTFILIANPSARSRDGRDAVPAGRRRRGHGAARRRAAEPPDDQRGARRPGARVREHVDDRHVDEQRADRRRTRDVVAGGRQAAGTKRTTARAKSRRARDGAWRKASLAGRVGKQTYILIANTSAFAGDARVTLLFEDGTTAEKTFTLQPNSRTNVNVEADSRVVREPALRRGDRQPRRDTGAAGRRARDVFELGRRRVGRRHERARDEAAVVVAVAVAVVAVQASDGY